MEFISKSEKDTYDFAKKLAKKLATKPGVCILLEGDLGAGKTVFAKGFVSFFEPQADVVSPTFTLVNDYGKVLHFDLYRIEKEGELFAIGADEMFFGNKFCLVEWPSRISMNLFPKNSIKVFINKIDDNTRKIVAEGI